jgi:hypothetical protein
MGNRYYPIGDKELASVTTITGLVDKSDGLIPWAVNCAVDWIKQNANTISTIDDARTKWREVRDEAGDIGTQVHDALEAYLQAYSAGEDYRLETTMAVGQLFDSAVSKLMELGKFTVLATEQKVVNEDEWYAGRFDALLDVDGETWLIDFKTGGAFYPEWGMQLAAYARAVDDMTHTKGGGTYKTYKWIDRIKVLRLDKKTLKAHWKEYGGEKDTLTRENYLTAFKGLRDAFYILRAKKAVKQAWLGR